jgi:16S rRNA (adenine1518-N6/adenine1519-N6)-dimethyltransferase
MERFGVRPNRELGQNFLVDDNILGVIGRSAELGEDDVVLEIGGGIGILSEYLADRVRHVHVVETDAKLEPVLRDALGGHGNADLVLGDVMDVELSDLRPPPGKVVANLPYGVAVPATVRTITELGAVSCEVEFLRPISRTVFQPQPNVDSALVRLRRVASACPPAVRRLVQAAFAHRRKALARSVSIALGSDEARDAARAALEEIGHPADERAERLAPAEFVDLAARLERWL